VVVVGVGNELMRDDGVGVHVVRHLCQQGRDERVEFIEAGTALAEALDLVPRGADVLVVDAARGGEEPGSVYRLGLNDVGTERGVSLHETSLPEAFALAKLAGTRFGTVVILGVEPGRVEVGTELSPPLREKLPAILDAVRKEVATLLSTNTPRGDRRR
jgi:hydrogenase maturation protease